MNIAAITKFKHGELRRLMKKLNWTGVELSKRTGIRYNTISAYLCLKIAPPPDAQIILQRAFGEAGEFLDIEKAWPDGFVGLKISNLEVEQYRDMEIQLLQDRQSTPLQIEEHHNIDDWMDMVMEDLSDREKIVLIKRAEGWTYTEIAKHFKLTVTRASQIEGKAIRILLQGLARIEIFGRINSIEEAKELVTRWIHRNSNRFQHIKISDNE